MTLKILLVNLWIYDFAEKMKIDVKEYNRSDVCNS